MTADEVVLADDGVTHVVRVGDTVRRPVRPFTATVQAYLTHLHKRGFHDAPEALGYDEQGREVLSYVTGDVPTEPPLIDFDMARPTTRVADLVNAMGWWVPLEHPADRPPELVGADIGGRLRLVADTYGLTPSQRTEVLPAALRRADNVVLTMRAAAAVDPVFRRWWQEGLADTLPRRREWLRAVADRLDAALRSG